jgi:hypothetical protein
MVKKRKPMVFEQRRMTGEEIKAFLKGCRCTWKGCEANCSLDDLPPDWINLLTWWSPRAGIRADHREGCHEPVFASGMLCCAGSTARELEALLESFPDTRLEQPKGQA